jgi:hypothetical protein
MKYRSTGTRIVSRYRRETWLRDQRHSTFTKLIRPAPPNQKNHGDDHDDAAGKAPWRA